MYNCLERIGFVYFNSNARQTTFIDDALIFRKYHAVYLDYTKLLPFKPCLKIFNKHLSQAPLFVPSLPAITPYGWRDSKEKETKVNYRMANDWMNLKASNQRLESITFVLNIFILKVGREQSY